MDNLLTAHGLSTLKRVENGPICGLYSKALPCPDRSVQPGPAAGWKARCAMMGSKLLRVACLIAVALVFLGWARREGSKGEMRFGSEAAERGLWREAVFRWERVLKTDPQNPRLRNNLAVGYESLGQFDRARQEYEEARRLDPDSKEIRSNFESFRALCKTIKTCPGEGATATPSPGPAGSEPSVTPPAGQEPAPPGSGDTPPASDSPPSGGV